MLFIINYTLKFRIFFKYVFTISNIHFGKFKCLYKFYKILIKGISTIYVFCRSISKTSLILENGGEHSGFKRKLSVFGKNNI